MLVEILMTTYSIALPIVLGYIVWLLKEQKKIKNANNEGVKCLLRVKLIEYHDKYTQEGSIPAYALENGLEMYKAYKQLGGNGMIDQMKHEVEKLPIRS